MPTLLTLVGIAYCNRPWRQSDWQEDLLGSLHVRAEISNVTRPRPGTIVLTDLRFADLQSSNTLASVDQLRLSRLNSRSNLKASGIEVFAEQLSEFVEAFATWLASGESTQLDFHAERLTIASQSWQALQLHNVSLRSEPTAQGGQRFILTANNDLDETLKVELNYENKNLSCAINAQLAQLPAWLIGELVPGIHSCGSASFSGVILAERGNQSTSGKLRGRVEHIDLQEWIGTDCPHRLQGLAELALEELSWSAGRIENARGTMVASNGAAGYSLLENAQKRCGCVTGRAWEATTSEAQDELVPFDKLALRFQLSPSGIVITGQCVEDALMEREHLPLMALQHPEILLPVGHFVGLFNYTGQPGWMPATRNAHNMADDLPLPGDE